MKRDFCGITTIALAIARTGFIMDVVAAANDDDDEAAVSGRATLTEKSTQKYQ